MPNPPLTPADSVIDPATLQAYRETEYCVLTEVPFSLHIDQISTDLIALQQHHQVKCSAFLTACNPFSQPLGTTENQARQESLAAELKNRGFSYMKGIGQHPSNNWPGEPSFLVLGQSLESVMALGSQFGQNAIVWNNASGMSSLILLR